MLSLKWIPQARGRAARVLGDAEAHPADRYNAAFRLARKGGEEAFRALARAVLDEDFWVRADAIRAMAHLEDPRSYPFYIHLLADPDDLVRFESRRALQHLVNCFGVDLLARFDRGEARANGALLAAAWPGRVMMNVLDRRMLRGAGIDVEMEIDGRALDFHRGPWRAAEASAHAFGAVFLDEETNVKLSLFIECGREEFSVRIECENEGGRAITNPRCVFSLSDDIGFNRAAGGRIGLSWERGSCGPAGVTLIPAVGAICDCVKHEREAAGVKIVFATEKLYSARSGVLLDMRLMPHPAEEDMRDSLNGRDGPAI